MWTSEKIDLVKSELKKYKDQIQSEELKKLKKDLLAGRDKKDPEGAEEIGEDEKPLTPSRGTMPSTSHQAVIIKQSQTPSLKSTDDDLDKSSDSSSYEEKAVFDEDKKDKKPVKKVLALKEMKEKEAKIDKLEDQIDDLKKVRFPKFRNFHTRAQRTRLSAIPSVPTEL